MSPEIPVAYPDPGLVQRAAELLAGAQRPLVIVGKGAAHARAEEEVRRLVVSLVINASYTMNMIFTLKGRCK